MSQTLDQNILSLFSLSLFFSSSFSLLRETIIQIVLSVLTFSLSLSTLLFPSFIPAFSHFLSLSHSLLPVNQSSCSRPDFTFIYIRVSRTERKKGERDARFSSLQNDSPTKYFSGRMFSDECSPKIRLVRPDLTFSLSPSLIPGTRFSPFPTFSTFSLTSFVFSLDSLHSIHTK